MTTLEMKQVGSIFVPADPKPNVAYAQIPKHNQRFVELAPNITEERTIELSVSSDKPYFRWFGWEELDHSEVSVDLSRFNDGAQVLFNHNRDDYIGIIQKAWLDGGKLYNKILFDTHELAEKIYQSISSGIVRNVSIGYEINEMKVTGQRDGVDVYRATRWTPFETSIVTVPADASVGVGRSYYIPAVGETLDKKEKSEAENMDDSTPTFEINEKDILAKERERTQAIIAAGAKYGCTALAQRAIDDGLSIEQTRSLILDEVKDRQPPVAKSLSPVDMSNKERRQYSFLKAIGYAAGKVSPKDVGLELEVSDHIQQTRMGGKAPEGIYVDQTQLVSYKRDPYDTQTPAAAGNLIATDLLSERFIDQLYNESAFLSMGVTYLRDLQGNVEIPRESSFTNGYWVGEGQPIIEDEGTFDKINLSPKKLACLTKMTYEMVNQASIDIERYARNRLIRGLALELDRTIGFGSGVGEEPLGIVSHPEVLSVVLGTNGGELTWSAIVDMIAEVDTANALNGGSFGWVVNARTKAKLMKTLDDPTTGAGAWIWQNQNPVEGAIAGYRARCSNQIPNNLTKGTSTNLSAIFFGDFSNVLMGIWSGLDVMVDPYTESTNAIYRIIAKQLVDIELTRGSYFSVATDIINS